MEGNFWFAFLLTLLAGMATGIGSIIAFFAKSNQYRLLSFGLGLSAGVMIYVSFMELLEEAQEALIGVYGSNLGAWIAIIAFIGGMLLTTLIDRLVPDFKNPHELKDKRDLQLLKKQNAQAKDILDPQAKDLADKKPELMRMGVFTAVAIAVHNFPEGIATFMAAMADPALGVSIAIAIAIHNIPEGISVSVPIFFATNNRKKAFIYSFLSGMAEPLGALVGYFILLPFLSESMLGIVFAAVAGIMIYISFDELLPMAREYDQGHTAIFGVITGMAVMAVSLIFI